LNTVVVGAGMVGQNLAEALYREGYNVTLIDSRARPLERASESLDIQTLQGHGADMEILAQAGAKQAEFFMAVTDSDEINLLACLVAKEMGSLLTVARVTSTAYLGGKRVFYRNLMGVDIVLSPENLTALEIAKQARAAGVVAVENLTGGRLQLKEVIADSGRPTVGSPLRELKLPKDTLVALLMRDGVAIVPGGDDVIRPGDAAFVIGRSKSMGDIEALVGKEVGKVSRAIVVGGGGIGLAAAQNLANLRVDVRLLERDAERCEELSEELSKGVVLNADGTDIKALREAGIEGIDLFVSASGEDEVNLAVGLLAGELGANKRVVVVKRPDFTPILERLGIDRAISPRTLTANSIMRYIRRRKFTNLATVGENRTEILDIIVSSKGAVVGRSLEDVDFPRGAIIGAIVRGDDVIIPRGGASVEPGDNVIVFAGSDSIPRLEKIF